MSELRDLQRALALRLTQTEQAQSTAPDPLQGIDPAELQRSREVLYRKRLSQVRNLLPKTASSLADDYPKLCRDFQSKHRFDGHRAPLLDAIHFVNWIQRAEGLAAWQKELADWESLPLQWIVLARWFAMRFYHYEFTQSGHRAIPPKRRSLWIAWRIGKWGRIWRVF